MQLVTFTHRHQKNLGAVLGDFIVDLPAACAMHRHDHDFPKDMLSLLRAGETAIQRARTAYDWVASSSVYQVLIPRDEVRLEAPISDPGKVICVGFNYYDVCRNNGIEIPKRPILFPKFASSIIGPYDAIAWHEDETSQVDYEAELAVVIGRSTHDLTLATTMDYVAGYTILNDVSARDVMIADQQWMRGKSFDTFCPIGPAIVTADEIPNPHNLRIRCSVNSQVVQSSSTKEMIFKIPELLEYISRTTTLLPGDIIGTGTPDGIGYFRQPQLFLRNGDLVTIDLEGIGSLFNSVRVLASKGFMHAA